jgi:vitamin B12 transporter
MKRLLLAVLLCAAPAQGQELALFSDPKTTKVSTPDNLDETLESVANSITVIDRQEIELRGEPFVSDLLRAVPGLDVSQTGGRGGTTSVFIRGLDSEHTLVLLDGVPLNDPSSPQRTADLADITTDNVERIEILRGPQSVLYGSDAIGGVINIITRKAPRGFRAGATGEYGSMNSSLGRLELGGSQRYLDYSLSGSRQATAGIPSAESVFGNTTKDGFLNGTFAGDIGIKPAEGLRLELSARHAYSALQLDPHGGSGGDDPTDLGWVHETDLGASASLALFDGRLKQKAELSSAVQDRRYADAAEPANGQTAAQSTSHGRTTRFNYQASGQLTDWDTLTVGLGRQEEEAETSYDSQSPYGPYHTAFDLAKLELSGVYAEDLARYDERFFVSFGGRLDDHDVYGKAETYRIAPACLIPETSTKLKATVGTGFKAPTLYELYSQHGAQNLLPERSSSWDAGIEQDFLSRKVTLGATYFDNRVRDLIDYNSATNVYSNIGKVHTQGTELTAQARPWQGLAAKADYTYTSPVDGATGADLLRRPRNKFGADVELRPTGRLSGLVGMTYTGPHDDLDDSNMYTTGLTPTVRVGGYALWHVSGSYQVSRHVSLTARVENLFNKRYEEVFGYGSPGVSAFGGVKLEF